MPRFKTHVVLPREAERHTHTAILLHGRDSDGADFASEFFESEDSSASASAPASAPSSAPFSSTANDNDDIVNVADDQDQQAPSPRSPHNDTGKTLSDLLPTVRWVFPSARIIPSTRFGNRDMTQWFDMWSTEDPQQKPEIQEHFLRSSVSALLELVAEEEKLVPRSRIFLGGISQGAATAVSAFLADGKGGIGGLVGLSSWLPLADRAEASEAFPELRGVYSSVSSADNAMGSQGEEGSDGIRETPVFLGHCCDDAVISVEHGRRLRDFLRTQELAVVEWHEYATGGHWINEPEGVDDLFRFFKANMGDDVSLSPRGSV